MCEYLDFTGKDSLLYARFELTVQAFKALLRAGGARRI